MPKRKLDKYSDCDFKYLTKKLKKLERKIIRGRRRREHSDDICSSDSEKLSPRKPQESDLNASYDNVIPENTDDALPGCSYWTTDVPYDDISERCDYNDEATHALPSAKTMPLLAASDAPIPPTINSTTVAQQSPISTTGQCSAPQPSLQVNELEHPTANREQASELTPELMEILGEDPTTTKEYGKDFQKDLANRLNHLVTSGLSKENRKALKDKYLIPANCKLIKAPTLNPEIRAALVESQAKRDKGIENKQMLTSCALSSLGEAITLLLLPNNKNPELLKLLMDTARILTDIQHSDSILRRFFILSTVQKELKDHLEKTKIDETLFGNNLSETLKSAKSINKSGADLRSASTIKSIAQNPGKPAARPLNYRAPPASRRYPPTGGARGARATYSNSRPTSTPTQPNASRTSSRQQAPCSRR